MSKEKWFLYIFLREKNNFRLLVKEIVEDVLKIAIYHTYYIFKKEFGMLGIHIKLVNVNCEFINFWLPIAGLAVYEHILDFLTQTRTHKHDRGE